MFKGFTTFERERERERAVNTVNEFLKLSIFLRKIMETCKTILTKYIFTQKKCPVFMIIFLETLYSYGRFIITGTNMVLNFLY